jgi:ATP-dependent helicase HrpA
MNEGNQKARLLNRPRTRYDDALPITARREDILAAIKAHQVVIVAGETGSGKTTQLPKMCLDAGRGVHGQIGCTQPRRIAARAMASRVAEELQCELGGPVGYQVRFRDRTSPGSIIKFMTDGILLAEAGNDRRLRGYDTIIIDEAHERSLNIDFLLGYLKQLLPARPDLKVLVTSATIDTEKFSKHFDDAPVIEVSGRGYPVDLVYQPLEESASGELRGRDLYLGIEVAVRRLDRVDSRGDILVFLSGEREIHEARDHLTRAGLRNTEVLPLYARLSSAEQQRVFHPGAQRRIILSTNVAETSLTVPRIRFVIDSGLARISRYAHRSRIQRLPIEPVSQASADQRKGRCGRLGPGTCIRLFSEEDFAARPEYTEPEILRTSLASVILRMLDMGLGAIEDFPFIDPPAPRMINDACQLLFELGATDSQRRITASGRLLARWPIDVRLGRMVLAGAAEGCLEDLLVLATGLSIQDPRERPLELREAADEAHERFVDDRSDFSSLLRLWAYLREQRRSRSGNQFRKMCRRQFLNWQRVLEWFDLYQQLRDQAREERLALKGGHGDYEQVHRAVLSGLLGLVGQKNPEHPGYTGPRNRGFHIFPGSGLFGKSPQWLMSAEIVETSKPYARVNARIDPAWIEELGAHLLKRHYFDPHWSSRSGRVMAWEQVSLFGLVIVEKRRVDYSRIDAASCREIFIREALVRERLDSRAAFMRHNQQLKEEVERLEHKRRQRDVLVDEQALQDFFEARIPADVNSAKGFAQWLESLDTQGRKRLHLSHAVLTREGAGQAPGEQFPDSLEAGGRRFPLEYLFEPGNPADGVTLTVPMEALNTLDAGRSEWLVPGLLREKLVELMRTLPKPLRRSLTPLPQFADAALEQLGEPGSQPLGTRLAQVLGELTGVDVSPEDFSPALLPDHLRLRVVVQGEEGAVEATGRDLAQLQYSLGVQARRRFMDREGGGFNRDGMLGWEVGTLPETMPVQSGAAAWPALVDQDEAVGLRLFDTPDEAAVAHLEGLHRLLSLELSDKMSSLRKHHRLDRETQLAWAPQGEVGELVADLAWHSLCAAAGDDAGRVRDPESWAQLAADTRSRIGAVFQKQAGFLDDAIKRFGAIKLQLASRVDESWPEAAADIHAQLDDLVYPGFLLELEPGRLQHYPRYLQSVQSRLERLVQDPQRDTRQQQQLSVFWQRYHDRLEAGHDYSHALDTYRWLLHEFRVSLFAQQLGTAEKVSPTRLEQAWEAVLAED